jgi:peptidyl-prolyl cis-trans isomerase B (cyclophilin B)
MKKWMITGCMLFLAASLSAQIGQYDGKPRYELEARRSGVPMGTIVVEMFPSIAPLHVRNFDSLVSIHFFDTTAFHRVIPGFVIQGGDPNSRHGPRSTWGYGDPSQQDVPAEFSPVSHKRGIFSAARDANINSANSQFFICVADQVSLDNNYTVYGRVVSGMAVVDQIVSAPRDANDNPLQKIEMFVSRGQDDATPVAVPQVIQPGANASGVSAAYPFQWDTVAGALLYELEFSRTPDFSGDIITKRVTKNTTTVAELEPGLVPYYWRMRANNGGYRSAYTTVGYFTTGAEAPALMEPAHLAVLIGNMPDLKWKSAEGAETYHVQVSTHTSFLPNFIRYEQGGIADTFVTTTALDPSRKHYWRVASEVNGVIGEYSPAWIFTTGISTGTGSSAASHLTLYPNPACQQLSIIMPNASKHRLSVYDVRGIVWKEMEIASDDVYTLDISGLSAGFYTLSLQSGSGLQRAVFSVAR